MENSITLAATAERSDFGQLEDGTRVEAVVLSNGNGVTVRVITLGATVQSLEVPDRNGHSADIVLGYADAARYLEQPQYLGSTVGRYANRIAKGRFSLDGEDYQLEVNSGTNHLHGGVRGFDKVNWAIESVSEGSTARVVMAYLSPAGDSGYPGALDVRTTYELNEQDELTIAYTATTDSPTVVNITNHSYFNLAGEEHASHVMHHKLELMADQFTPVDASLIPTGELRSVAGTPFDFREPQAIGSRMDAAGDEQLGFGSGYDHNFVVSGDVNTLRLAARVEEPDSGRVMELLTTAPGLQFYTGNFLSGPLAGKSERVYQRREAFCLEPQAFPDTPNQPAFPSARLDPGETYRHTMVLRFSTIGRED